MSNGYVFVVKMFAFIDFLLFLPFEQQASALFSCYSSSYRFKF